VVCIAPFTHNALQVVELPCSVRSWQPMGSHFDGQVPSQISSPSTVPLPQDAAQSLSEALVQPEGQQPSAFTHLVCWPAGTQAAWQVPGWARANS